jgi:hypothetical protein
MNLEKHIWEGWTVKDFIDELDDLVSIAVSGQSHFKTIINKQQLKQFCMDNQPYYKKHIPEVVDYFAKQYQIS